MRFKTLEKVTLSKLAQAESTFANVTSKLGEDLLNNTQTDTIVRDAINDRINSMQPELMAANDANYQKLVTKMDESEKGIYAKVEELIVVDASNYEKLNAIVGSAREEAIGAVKSIEQNLAQTTQETYAKVEAFNKDAASRTEKLAEELASKVEGVTADFKSDFSTIEAQIVSTTEAFKVDLNEFEAAINNHADVVTDIQEQLK